MAAPKQDRKALADDARAAALDKFIKRATRGSAGAVFTFNGPALPVPSISTGALSLDVALGVGGLPRGRIIEIFGPESAGKTSLALSTCANAIRGGGLVGFVDVEHAISPSHIKGMGVDIDYFALAQPSSGEEALAMAEDMVKEGVFDIVVVDSVAALVPQVELDGEMGDVTVGAQARLMSKALRRMTAIAAESDTMVIFINQLREKIGGYGNPETTPGGRALKFYASVRLDVRAPAGERIKDPADVKRFLGLGTNVTVVKNKVAPPQRKASYQLIWGKGIDFASSVFEVAVELGVLTATPGYNYVVASSGEMIADGDGKPVKGKEKVKAVLSTTPALATAITDACYTVLRAAPHEPAATPEVEDVFDEDGSPFEADTSAYEPGPEQPAVA